MSERWEILFSGRVQGVGFRYQALLLAQDYAVTGWVANLPSGQVELVVEGEASQISEFVDRLKSKMSSFIRNVRIEKRQPQGVFTSFEIRH